MAKLRTGLWAPVVALMLAGNPSAAAEETTGVPSHLVNRDVPSDVQALVSRGDLTNARETLKRAVEDGSAGTSEAVFQAEIARLGYLAREYSVSENELLQKIRKEIPAATLEDVKRWTQQRALQWITVDGQIRYFRREPGILLRFDEDAKKLAGKGKDGDPAAGGRFKLADHIAEALDDATSSGKEFVKPIRFKVSHTVTVKPGRVPAGEMIRCWVPFPQQYRQQKDVVLKSTTPANPMIAPNGAPQRTVYMEQASNGNEPTVFKANYEYTSSAAVPNIAKLTRPPREPQLERYTKPEPPHITFSPAVQELADKLKSDTTHPMNIAYRMWDHVEKTIKWCPEMEYVVMPNIVDKVMADDRGDCGTQALMFVALCRAAGVPARWQSGWVTKPGGWNLHDWAEFWTLEHGWLPADPSVGRQESERADVRDFLFRNIDAYRMIANLQHNAQFTPPKTHHRSDPVDNQRGEVEWKSGNLFYDDWSYDVKVQQEKLD